MSENACVWVDPGRRGGYPCINRTRLCTDMIANDVASGMGVDEVRDMYGAKDDDDYLTARKILVACWFEATYKPMPPQYLTHRRARQIRKAWQEWAVTAGDMLWHTTGPLPDWPPEVPS